MLTASAPASLDSRTTARPDRLPLPWADEATQVERLKQQLQDKIDWGRVRQLSEPWVRGVRRRPPAFWALDSLLREFPLNSQEGLALMRLAEALLRIPDQATALELLSSQLEQVHGRPSGAASQDGHRPWSAEASLWLLDMAGKLLPGHTVSDAGGPAKLLQRLTERLGSPAVLAAATRALQLLGRQFVLGEHVSDALERAQVQTAEDAQRNLLTQHSFDMLGEGARSWEDADRYLAAYQEALRHMAALTPNTRSGQPTWGQRPGLSVKLSALHPRFEPAHAESVMLELVPRLTGLIKQAHRAGLMLTIDAEESFRLELQLAVLEAVLTESADGLGLAIQAYQHRALDMIAAVIALAQQHERTIGVRLVKGAYWDSEIKRAQELGLDGYPVYTSKAHTDLSYLACADMLLAHTDCIYPQFATHNATTIAAVLALVGLHGVQADQYEWQRLQGMGEALYREARQTTPSHMPQAALRIYAPVGEHRDLLAYLVRRLLENGANSSFVHQLTDPAVSLDELLCSPWVEASGTSPSLPMPAKLFGTSRRNAKGKDLQCEAHRRDILSLLEARPAVRQVAVSTAEEAQASMKRLHEAWPAWDMTPAAQRCEVLERTAALLESEFDSWVVDLVTEARKTMADALAEVRETIDLARYYAQQGRQHLLVQDLPGPTGESNEWQLRSRGVFVCIAPWNFPLAIFGGQVMGALVCGNAVAAKPAEQTPAIGQRFMRLLERAGAPAAVLGFAHGAGDVVGAALVASRYCAGVAFTGSVATAKRIQRMLALGDRPIIPLIAETGGLNAMVVDSSAHPEQVVDAVISSAFLSAGQRCSALRLLCLHEAMANRLETLLAGAMQTLRVGQAHHWPTDVGPVIDRDAQEHLLAHVADLRWQAEQPGSGIRLIAQCEASDPDAVDIVPPSAWALPQVQSLTEEHFGPILHVVRWGPGTAAPDLDTLMAQINSSGYGLTLGVQTRIDRRARKVAQLARVGNVYVNRPMTGAVVGSQPFGGQGWSGTGPKAGGPHYLLRFCTEQVVSINTAAAGGNAALLMQMGRSG